MNYITRSKIKWYMFLNTLNILKKENGSLYINESINVLNSLLNNELIKLDKYIILFKAFYDLEINSLIDAIGILNNLKDIYSFDNILNNLNKIDVDMISFVDIKNNIKVDSYINLMGVKKLILAKDVSEYKSMDLRSNGIITNLINSNKEFMTFDYDFINKKNLKTYITSSFRFNSVFNNNLLIDINKERDELFILLLNTLNKYKTNIILSNPNININNNLNELNKYNSYCSDGLLKNEWNEYLFASKTIYLSKKIMVSNARFVAISYIKNNNIEYVDLIVNEDYYNYIMSNNRYLVK